MAETEEGQATVGTFETGEVLHGIIGGLIGGVVFGVMMQMQMPGIMEGAIPGMYGLGESLAIGWVLHLFHAAVFGLIYVGIAQIGSLRDAVTDPVRGAGLGIIYGLVIWVIAASIVMPLWVGAMTPMDPPVPQFMMDSAVGHAVFGVLLGGYYGYIVGR